MVTATISNFSTACILLSWLQLLYLTFLLHCLDIVVMVTATISNFSTACILLSWLQLLYLTFLLHCLDIVVMVTATISNFSTALPGHCCHGYSYYI